MSDPKHKEEVSNSELLSILRDELKALLLSPNLPLQVRKEVEAMLLVKTDHNTDLKGDNLCS